MNDNSTILNVVPVVKTVRRHVNTKTLLVFLTYYYEDSTFTLTRN